MSSKKMLGLIIALVVIVGAILFAYFHYKAEKKADKAGMRNPSVCKNEDDKWVTIPNGFYKNKKKGECTEGTPPSPAPSTTTVTPIAQGTTPCTLHVSWGTVMKTGGRPVLIKYHGKTKWVRLSGRENDKISLDQFAPGDAQFASTDSIPVDVKIFPPTR